MLTSSTDGIHWTGDSQIASRGQVFWSKAAPTLVAQRAGFPPGADASGKGGRGGFDRATPTLSLVLVASAFDFSDHKAAAYITRIILAGTGRASQAADRSRGRVPGDR